MNRASVREILPNVGLVALGGAAGTLARYLLDALVGEARGLPAGTFIANILGAFALGLLVESLAPTGGGRGPRIRLLLGTGLLGGFTTYSALAVGTVAIMNGSGSPSVGAFGLGASYALVTLICGAAASWLGIAMAHRAQSHRSIRPRGEDAA